jgi:hypothetical protein
MIARSRRTRIGPTAETPAENPQRLPVLGAVGTRCLALEVDSEFPQFNDCCSAPADRVGGEGEREGHPVLLAEWLAVAQDVVVARSRLDGEAGCFEPADELPHVFSHLATSGSATGRALGGRVAVAELIHSPLLLFRARA